jgi:hypothetical protein
LHFEAEIIDGELTANEEIKKLDMHGMDGMRGQDGFVGKIETIIYDDYDV